MESENHFVKKSGWLRASVLGANNGIISTTSLVIGIAVAIFLGFSKTIAAKVGE